MNKSANDEIQQLEKKIIQLSLDKEKIEKKLIQVQQENDAEFKSFTHELAGAIQILILSVDSIENNPDRDSAANLKRIKRASNNLVSMINKFRSDRKKEESHHMVK